MAGSKLMEWSGGRMGGGSQLMEWGGGEMVGRKSADGVEWRRDGWQGVS